MDYLRLWNEFRACALWGQILDIFMRAMIFLIFDSFDSVPKDLDSQAQGLKVPASTGGCSGKVIRDRDAADVQH